MSQIWSRVFFATYRTRIALGSHFDISLFGNSLQRPASITSFDDYAWKCTLKITLAQAPCRNAVLKTDMEAQSDKPFDRFLLDLHLMFVVMNLVGTCSHYYIGERSPGPVLFSTD